MMLVVIWNGMWETAPPIPSDLPSACAVSMDRSLAASADAVVFHLPSLQPELFVEGHIRKRSGQVWVAWSSECELHYPWLADAQFMERFDLRMTYRLDSDIPCTYVPADFLEDLATRHSRIIAFDGRHSVLANAFISSPYDRSGRGPLLLAMMDRMAIGSYGKLARNQELGGRDDGSAFKLATQASYKFSLVFENACCHDYVTEKFFQPLLVGSVPVVLGAPNISRFAPGERCYIDVRDFISVDSLVSFLSAVAADRERYEQFHAWRHQPLRDEFLQLIALQRQDPWCRLCRWLQSR